MTSKLKRAISPGDLDVPVPTQTKGITGIRSEIMLPIHMPGNVVATIINNSYGYGDYIDKAWDCEDYAFLAAADVRLAHQGQPVGIALGTGPAEGGPGIAGNPHAVNVLWFRRIIGGKEEWYPRYFDATNKGMEYKNFDADVILPIPWGDSFNAQKFPIFENYEPLQKAAFVLDGRDYDFNLTRVAEKMLVAWKRPNDPQKGIKVDQAVYTFSDRVFWWFAHIRKEVISDAQKGLPVGIAFGKILKDNATFLILWDDPNTYKYWDIVSGKDVTKIFNKRFIPYLVIV